MARRRIDEPAAPDPRQANMFAPDERGIPFMKCECGLTVSTGPIENAGGKCPGCGREIKIPDALKKQDQAPVERKPIPAGAPEAKPGELACHVCGAALTQTSIGIHYPCGHEGVKPKSKQKISATLGNVADVSPTKETVTVVWAEEQFSPQPYHSFRVGPFTATLNRNYDETIAQAWKRGMDQLRALAEAERVQKFKSYMEMVEKTGAKAR